jgi:hypothetical protein
MPFSVEFPDGLVIEDIPDGTPREVIAQRYEQETGKPAPPPSSPEPEKGLIERSYDTARQGVSDAFSTIAGETYGAGGDPTARRDENVLGKTASVLGSDLIPAAGEVISDAVITAGKAALPQSGERLVAEGVQSVVGSEPVQAAMGAWGDFEESSPDLARRVAQGVNIGSAFAPAAKSVPKMKFGSNAALRQGGKIADDRKTLTARLLEPDMDEQTTLRVTDDDSFLGVRQYNPTAFEQDVIDEVTRLKTVDPKGSQQAAVNAVQAEVKRLANDLDNKLAGVELDSKTVYNRMIAAVNEAGKHPALVGDASESAVRMFSIFDDMLKDATKGKKTITARDLLDVRRRFDDELIKFSSPSSAFVNAKRGAGDTLRQKMNDIIIEAAPEAKVAESLGKQHRLLSARNTIAPRAAGEARTRIGRLIDNLARSSGIHSPTTPLALKATATDMHTSIAMATLAGGWGISRALTKETRRNYVRLLKAVENAINRGGPLADKLKADKAALVALLAQDTE